MRQTSTTNSISRSLLQSIGAITVAVVVGVVVVVVVVVGDSQRVCCRADLCPVVSC